MHRIPPRRHFACWSLRSRQPACPRSGIGDRRRSIKNMKTPHLVLAILACAPLTAFAEQREIVIKCVIGKGNDSLVLGPSKSPMKAAATKEIHFATEWDLPKKIKNAEGYTTYQPLTPLAFETANAGWQVQCVADTVGNLIRVTGSAAFSEPELTQAVFGEQSGPIYSPEKKNVLLTPNVSKTVSLHSSNTPFQVFLTPGKEYTFKIRRLDKWIPCKITCTYGTK